MATQAAQVTVKPRSELGLAREQAAPRRRACSPASSTATRKPSSRSRCPKKEVVNHLNHGAHLFDLALDGKSEKVLVKEVQYDHLGIEVLHVDFARVSLDEKVEVTVPLELKGTPKGEEEGGVLQQIIDELEIECLVTDIPDVDRHNVSEMAQGRGPAHQGPEAPAGREVPAGRGPDRRDGEGDRGRGRRAGRRRRSRRAGSHRPQEGRRRRSAPSRRQQAAAPAAEKKE